MTTDLADALHDLVAQHGLVAVLQKLASVMAETGNVTGGMISEIAAIEDWLAAQHNAFPRN
jgi:hypothetical protein